MRNLILWILFFFLGVANASEIARRYTEPFEQVSLGSLPWVVHLTNIWGAYFNGVLVSSKYIFTSAHGLDQFIKTDCLNANFRNAENPFSIKVKRYILHPEYASYQNQGLENDFAIIELNQNINLDDNNIELPQLVVTDYFINVQEKDQAVYGASFSKAGELVKVELNYLSKSNQYQLFYSGISETGDSGSPLFYLENGTAFLLAILDSSSKSAGGINSYEPVVKYLDFISNNTDLLGSLYLQSETNSDWKNVKCIFNIVVGITVVLTVVGMIEIACFIYVRKHRVRS